MCPELLLLQVLFGQLRAQDGRGLGFLKAEFGGLDPEGKPRLNQVKKMLQQMDKHIKNSKPLY